MSDYFHQMPLTDCDKGNCVTSLVSVPANRSELWVRDGMLHISLVDEDGPKFSRELLDMLLPILRHYVATGDLTANPPRKADDNALEVIANLERRVHELDLVVAQLYNEKASIILEMYGLDPGHLLKNPPAFRYRSLETK